MRASPVRFSDRTGLRLCGIAEEPFWPSEKNSSASSTSVRCKCLISVASRSTEVAITRNHLRGDRLGLEPHRLGDMRLHAGIDLRKRADGAGDGAGRDLLAGGDKPLAGAGEFGVGVGELEA